MTEDKRDWRDVEAAVRREFAADRELMDRLKQRGDYWRDLAYIYAGVLVAVLIAGGLLAGYWWAAR